MNAEYGWPRLVRGAWRLPKLELHVADVERDDLRFAAVELVYATCFSVRGRGACSTRFAGGSATAERSWRNKMPSDEIAE